MPARTISTPIQEVQEPPTAAPARPTSMLLPFDPILLLAVLGLCAASLATIAGATADDIPGQPGYYVQRQAAFFAVGLIIALVLSRLDY